MHPDSFDVMRTVSNACFNDKAAAELLLELSRLAPTALLALRVLNLVERMHRDACALDRVSVALASGELQLLSRAPSERSR